MSEFDKLPTDVIIYMALSMDLPEILNLCTSSKKFNRIICLNNTFWMNRLSNDYNVSNVPQDKPAIEYYKEARERNIQKLNRRLVSAAVLGDLDMVKESLEKGANIKFGGNMALVKASSYGYLNIVKYLVEKGADIHHNADNSLRLAIVNDHLDVVKYLVDKGSRIDDSMIVYAQLYGYNDIHDFLTLSQK